MQSGSRKKFGKSQRVREKHVGREAIVLLCIAAVPWGYTFLTVYPHFVAEGHFHPPMFLVICDIVTLLFAAVMTLEWWRKRKKGTTALSKRGKGLAAK